MRQSDSRSSWRSRPSSRPTSVLRSRRIKPGRISCAIGQPKHPPLHEPYAARRSLFHHPLELPVSYPGLENSSSTGLRKHNRSKTCLCNSGSRNSNRSNVGSCRSTSRCIQPHHRIRRNSRKRTYNEQQGSRNIVHWLDSHRNEHRIRIGKAWQAIPTRNGW